MLNTQEKIQQGNLIVEADGIKRTGLVYLEKDTEVPRPVRRAEHLRTVSCKRLMK